jgi:hypothetical protein
MISPKLQGLYDSLAGYERPSTVMTWLGKPTAGVLRELGTGQRPLTHESELTGEDTLVFGALPPGP